MVGALLLALSAGMAAAQIVAQDVITCSKGDPERCDDSSGHDRITGNGRSDYIYAKGGPDLVNAEDEVATALGGSGDDDPCCQSSGLEGGAGNDTVKGQSGNDTVKDQAQGDADKLFGNASNDFMDGRDGDRQDILDCGRGKDVYARDARDTVKSNCKREL